MSHHGRTSSLGEKAMITPLREPFTIDVAESEHMEVQGTTVDHRGVT